MSFFPQFYLENDRAQLELFDTTGMICVIGNECGQMFTYEINGPEAKYVGDGDLHDPKYDYLERFSYFLDLRKARSNERGYTGLPLSTDYCPYWIRVYPSVRTEDTHTSKDPIFFTVSAIVIFLFTSLVFVIYDVCVERRQVSFIISNCFGYLYP